MTTQAHAGQSQATTKNNPLAIASFVLALLWLFGLGSLLAVILGHIALRQIAGAGGSQGGRGFAIAGLVLGYLALAVLAVGLLL
jgi:hypothetical protein